MEMKTVFRRCVSLSGYLADIWLNEDKDRAFTIAAGKAGDLLGMGKVALGGVLERISDAMPEMSKLFEIEISNPEQSEMIMEQARETLMMRNLKTLYEFTEGQKKAMAHVNELEEKAFRDPLTKLYNREYLNKSLGQ